MKMSPQSFVLTDWTAPVALERFEDVAFHVRVVLSNIPEPCEARMRSTQHLINAFARGDGELIVTAFENICSDRTLRERHYKALVQHNTSHMNPKTLRKMGISPIAHQPSKSRSRKRRRDSDEHQAQQRPEPRELSPEPALPDVEDGTNRITPQALHPIEHQDTPVPDPGNPPNQNLTQQTAIQPPKPPIDPILVQKMIDEAIRLVKEDKPRPSNAKPGLRPPDPALQASSTPIIDYLLGPSTALEVNLARNVAQIIKAILSQPDQDRMRRIFDGPHGMSYDFKVPPNRGMAARLVRGVSAMTGGQNGAWRQELDEALRPFVRESQRLWPALHGCPFLGDV